MSRRRKPPRLISDTPCQSASVTILGTRFDTVVVSARASVKPDVFREVRAAHEASRVEHQSTGKVIVDTITVGGLTYEVHALGRRTTPFVVRNCMDAGIEIGLGAPQARDPNIRIRLGAVALDGRDARAIDALVDDLLKDFCSTVRSAHVAEMDLAGDWQGWTPPWDPMLYVRRGLPSTLWQDANGRVTGLGIGYSSPRHSGERPRAKSSLALRIDDKTQEIRDHSGKTWLLRQWARLSGYWPLSVP